MDLVANREVEIFRAGESEKGVLGRMLELMQCEASAYDSRDLNPYGEFGYEWLEYYWKEDERFPFLLKVEGLYAGFALVNRYTYIKDAQYSMAEFFIMPKYRKLGMGKHLASQLFQAFSGRWEVRTHAANASGAAFWSKIIVLATEGVFDEFPNGNDRWKGPIWTFEAV